MYAAQMDDFLRRIAPGDPYAPPSGAPTAETGLAALAIVERAYASARSTA